MFAFLTIVMKYFTKLYYRFNAVLLGSKILASSKVIAEQFDYCKLTIISKRFKFNISIKGGPDVTDYVTKKTSNPYKCY